MYKTQVNQIRHLDKQQYLMLRKLCQHSARLYNYGLYCVKQTFEETRTYLNYENNYHHCKTNENYEILPSVIGQQTLKIVDRGFRSFFNLIKQTKNDYRSNRVSLPKFLKKTGYFQLTIPTNGFQIKGNKLYIGLSKQLQQESGLKRLEFDFHTQINPKSVKEIRIHPHHNAKYFTLEIVYKVEVEERNNDPDRILSIDLGLNNLATCFDSETNRAFIIDGKRIKSINYYWNKRNAHLQSIKDHQKVKGVTEQQYLITQKRNNQVKDYMRKSAKYIIDYCLDTDIGTLVVGHNKGQKQQINIGKRNNQNFVQIPFGYFMNCLKSKCQEYSIEYKEVQESHTSKCSYLDCEEIKHHENYMGKRVKRGLFKSALGVEVNADLNGAANICRKVTGDYSLDSDQIEGFVANPVRIRLSSV